MEDWLDDIRKSQSDFGLDAPENLWEGIEAGLSAAEAPGKENPGTPSRRVLPWAVIGLSSACAAALALFLLLPDRGEMPPAVHDEIALVKEDKASAEEGTGKTSDSSLAGRLPSLIAEVPAEDIAVPSPGVSPSAGNNVSNVVERRGSQSVVAELLEPLTVEVESCV